MALKSNIDLKPLTDRQRYLHEREERRDAFIDAKIRTAEKAEKEQGHASPSVILSGFQRDDAFTQDLDFDASRAALENRTSLPVKQYEINPDGTMVKVLGDAAQEAVKDGIFCFRCEERQPDDQVEKRRVMKRAEEAGIMLRNQWNPKENCCYCGARLGLAGESTYIDAPASMASDQRDLLDVMMNSGGLKF